MNVVDWWLRHSHLWCYHVCAGIGHPIHRGGGGWLCDYGGKLVSESWLQSSGDIFFTIARKKKAKEKHEMHCVYIFIHDLI